MNRKKIIKSLNSMGIFISQFEYSDGKKKLLDVNKEFYSAEAKIKHNNLVWLSSRFVKKPKYARYAWSDTSSATLFNSEGLPASSFTTEPNY